MLEWYAVWASGNRKSSGMVTKHINGMAYVRQCLASPNCLNADLLPLTALVGVLHGEPYVVGVAAGDQLVGVREGELGRRCRTGMLMQHCVRKSPAHLSLFMLLLAVRCCNIALSRSRQCVCAQRRVEAAEETQQAANIVFKFVLHPSVTCTNAVQLHECVSGRHPLTLNSSQLCEDLLQQSCVCAATACMSGSTVVVSTACSDARQRLDLKAGDQRAEAASV